MPSLQIHAVCAFSAVSVPMYLLFAFAPWFLRLESTHLRKGFKRYRQMAPIPGTLHPAQCLLTSLSLP